MLRILSFIKRLRNVRDRTRQNDDLEDEMQAHLALKQRALESQGLPADEAYRRARLSFGNETAYRESIAEQWSFPRFESLWRDLAFGARILAKDKIFAAVALLTLTLGIGANAAVFTLLNGLLWRALPVREPRQLVRIRLVNLPPTDRAWMNGRAVTPKERRRLSFALFETLQNQDLFQGAFGIAGQGSFVADVGGEAHKLQVATNFRLPP